MEKLSFTEITSANRADFQRLMRIYAKELDEHQCRTTDPGILEKWTDSIIEKQHDKGRCLKLCSDGTELVGFLYGKIDYPDDRGYKKAGYGCVMEFFVLTDHRGKGYGKEMLRCLERFFTANGIRQIYLTADPVTGVPFWKKMGFSRTGEISPENGLEIYQKVIRDEIVITVSDYLSRELAAEIAAAQWHCAEWSDRVTSFLYDYKTGSDIFNVIAKADGEIVGRLQCFRSMENKLLWQYGDFFVKPEFRRRHIGEQMLKTALDVLRDRGCRKLRCYVEPNNVPSLNLQRKHGFTEKPFKAFDNFINDGELMFEKELQNFEAVPAGGSDAYYICEIYEKSIEALHGGELDEQGCKEFFSDIKEMLTNRDPDEENFLIYFGALPCGWIKVNGLESGDIGWISMLAVQPCFRRRGAGRFAVNFAENFLEEKGKKIARIKTTEDNIPARTLYENCGFAVADRGRAISGDGAERVYLTLEKKLK